MRPADASDEMPLQMAVHDASNSSIMKGLMSNILLDSYTNTLSSVQTGFSPGKKYSTIRNDHQQQDQHSVFSE